MRTLWTFGCSFTAEYDPIDGIFFPFENDFDKYKKSAPHNFDILFEKYNSTKIANDFLNLI